MRANLRATLFLGLGLILSTQVTSSFAARATQLRIVIVVDTRAKSIGAGCKVGADILTTFIKDEVTRRVDGFRYTLDTLAGTEATSASVLAFIDRLVVAPTENLMFYYCGHGATVPQLGHVLTFSNDRNELPRKALREALFKKKAKGTLIFSDACANFQEAGRTPAAPAGNFTAFPDLFLDMDGVVDINGAAPGEFAWFTGDGGVFTNALTGLISASRSWFRVADGQPIYWDRGYLKLREMTKGVFDQLKEEVNPKPESKLGQALAQTPAFINLPFFKRVSVTNHTNEPIRLGARWMYSAQGEWYPAQEGTTAPFEVAPGASLKLTTDQGAIASYVTQWEAKGVNTGRDYAFMNYNMSPGEMMAGETQDEFTQVINIVPQAYIPKLP